MRPPSHDKQTRHIALDNSKKGHSHGPAKHQNPFINAALATDNELLTTDKRSLSTFGTGGLLGDDAVKPFFRCLGAGVFFIKNHHKRVIRFLT